MTGISRLSATQMARRGKREGDRKGDSPREYACCRVDIARRILTVARLARYYGTFAKRHGHISHPGAHFDLAPRGILGTFAPPGDHFNYLTGSSISVVPTRDEPGIVIQVLTIL